MFFCMVISTAWYLSSTQIEFLLFKTSRIYCCNSDLPGAAVSSPVVLIKSPTSVITMLE